MLPIHDLSAPSLSGAYAPPVAVLSAPAFARPAADASPAEVDRFRSRHRRGKAGVVVFAASGAAAAVGTVAMIGGALAYTGGSEVGGAVSLAGVGVLAAAGVGSVVGQVLWFEGAIGASKIAGVDPTLGWVGVGLVVGSVPVTMVLGSIDPSLTVVGTGMSVAGLVCGGIQLASAGSAGRDRQWISWHLAPSPRGIGVAGTF